LARRLAIATAGVVGASLFGLLFLTGLAAKEHDNRFCVACHLHDEKFQRLTAAMSTDLAGFHHAKDTGIGCIGCHGGSDLQMRFAIWAVAGMDTVRFLIGRYGEPTVMRLPLRDVDCRQCHTPILKNIVRTAEDAWGRAERTFETEAETEGRGGTSYHAIREHDSVRLACVRCHGAHTTDSEASRRFISQKRVAPLCRECHRTM
jgi:predicted CXXCH cytochrome family protein